MSCTVFATTMGFFSQNSGGQGVAPLDTCLTAPTPPAGPVPVPYVNVTFAKDLDTGSVTVKADKGIVSIGSKGKTSKSTGDEPGNIMTKGVASLTNTGGAKFQTWSFTVLIEGDGVNCMGDMMIQNTDTSGTLMNCLDPAAIVQFAAALAQMDMLKPCPKPYSKACRPDRDPSPEQTKEVDGKPCWECEKLPDRQGKPPLWNTMFDENGKIVEKTDRDKQVRQRDKPGSKEAMTHDHQPPLAVAWDMGGCHLKASPDKFKELFEKKEMVKPHCRAHYMAQGRAIRGAANRLTPA